MRQVLQHLVSAFTFTLCINHVYNYVHYVSNIVYNQFFYWAPFLFFRSLHLSIRFLCLLTCLILVKTWIFSVTFHSIIFDHSITHTYKNNWRKLIWKTFASSFRKDNEKKKEKKMRKVVAKLFALYANAIIIFFFIRTIQ